jgi:hypothetical protein
LLAILSSSTAFVIAQIKSKERIVLIHSFPTFCQVGFPSKFQRKVESEVTAQAHVDLSVDPRR